MIFENFVANQRESPFCDIVCFKICSHSAKEENVFSCSYITFIISKLYTAKMCSIHLFSFLKYLTRLHGRKPV